MVNKAIDALQNAKHKIIELLHDIGRGEISKEMAIEELDQIEELLGECRENIK